MKSKILKSIVIILLLLGCLVIIVLQKKKSDENYQSISKLNSIDTKTYELKKELEDIESHYQEASYGKAGITFLVDQVDATVVSFIYPVLKKMDYNAVIAFDLKHLPGDDDTITEEEFQMLMDEGWSYCIRWDGKTAFHEYMTQMSKRCKEKKLKFPQTLYVARGYYTEDLKEQAKNYKIHNMIHHGENDKSSIAIYNKNTDIWEIGSLGYLNEMVSSYVKIAVEKGGCLILSIGNGSGDELFNMNSMNTLLNNLKKYVEDDSLMVDTLGNIRKYKMDLAKDQDQRNKNYEKESNKLKEQLEELEEERENQRDTIQ